MSSIEWVKRLLSKKRSAYIRTFRNPVGQEVLEDQAVFCRATTPTYNSDPRIHALLEGRREVFLRIQKNINLSDEELWDMHSATMRSSSKQNTDLER